MLPTSRRAPHFRHRRGPRGINRPTLPLLIVSAAVISVVLVGYLSWALTVKQEAAAETGGTNHWADRRALERHKVDSHSLWAQPTEEQRSFCHTNFGRGWVTAWNATVRSVCRAPSSENHSRLRCRMRTDPYMTPASAPHVLCDAVDLVLQPQLMPKATHPKYRPGYLTSAERTYHRYNAEAFASACNWQESPRNLEAFPKDHLRDIMESFRASAINLKVERVEQTPTLLVTREFEEHANVFHTMTDLMNVYITLRMLAWDLHAPRRVILLDNHPHGPLDGLWPAVAAGGGAAFLNAPAEVPSEDAQPLVRRVEGLGQGALKLSKAAFVPPGYTSLLYAHLYENNSCPFPTSLFKGFRSFMLEPLSLLHPSPAQFQGRLKATLISRKPKGAKLVRGIANEEKLLQMLQGIPNLDASLVDLAAMPLTDQLFVITHTDILIGMHGAALAWTLLMPEHGGVVELWPQSDGIWRCYEHFSEWSGLLYRRWSPSTKENSASPTEVDTAAVKSIIVRMLPHITRRRIAIKQDHGFHGNLADIDAS